MASYIIYTYQFSPIVRKEKDLFETSQIDVEDLMNKKQDLFENILKDNDIVFSSQQGKPYQHKILFHQSNIIVLKLANHRYTNLEINFLNKKQEYEPSCLIIIDNRHDIQHIAIEDDSSSFNSTEMVKSILEFSFRRQLKQHRLTIDIKRDFQVKEFWDIVSQHHDRITMVRFHFAYPNLPRVSKSIKKMISEQSRKVGSKETTLEFKTGSSEQLVVEKSNRTIGNLAKASAESGHNIVLKIRGISSMIKVGDSVKRISFDNLEACLSEKDLFGKGFQLLIEKLNSIK